MADRKRPWVPQHELAARLGVTTMAVSKAVSAGRISSPAVEVFCGRPRIVDADEAVKQFHARVNLSQRREHKARDAAQAGDPAASHASPVPSDDELPDIATSNKRKIAAEARLSEIKLQKEMSKLVPAADVQAAIEEAFTKCKTRVLGIHVRARQQIPHLTEKDVAFLEELEREACEELVAELGETP